MTDQLSLFGSDETPEERQHTSEPVTAGEPLAARMRPRTLDEVVGQQHLLGADKILRRSIEADRISSMIFWGPPGSGKTTLAEVIAQHTHARFVRLSAVSAGVADLRKTVEEARRLRASGKRTILFIDEIHRFNKAQQDAILPHVENGTVTLIGATTENPSFEVNNALLSRSRVFVLKSLNEEQIMTILQRALYDPERGLGQLNVTMDENALQQIASYASGDARTALNVLELAVQSNRTPAAGSAPIHITLAMIEDVMQHRALQYDKSGDQHYDMISALHKSVRGSDPDGSIYWLVRMLEAGEDPLYIMRRVVRMASEDIGMADPQALVVCMAAQQAVHFVGLPEASLALQQAVVYLATAPKSNALEVAYARALADVQNGSNDPVPLWLRNAPTRLMKNLDYGKAYKYAHDYYKNMPLDDPDRPPAEQLQEYLPERLKDHRYYEPGVQGKEASVKKWLEKRWDGKE
ncbi:MAG TPA: replication-associated recombination protein A [Ktedonobacteraceae bacterium]|nr:replication-associated recombination protein A [Ktedonobacteraceae bacterium]